MVGMLPFCLVTHQRADLLIPLYVPASILAGRELARWLQAARRSIFAGTIGAICILGLAGIYYKFHYTTTPAIRQTAAIGQLANTIRRKVGADFPLTHVDDPVALDIELNTMRPLYYGPTKLAGGVYDKDRHATYDYDAAARLLEGQAAAFVVTLNPDEIKRRMTDPAKLYDLAHADLPDITLHVISNRPSLQYESDMAMGVGPLTVETNGLKLTHASAIDFAVQGAGSLSIANLDAAPQDVRIIHAGKTQLQTIGGNSVWTVTFPRAD
jgi:hypothetical protein